MACAGGVDCEDLSWRRHPGATELCDGLLQDCDLTLDEGCDRFCDQPSLFTQGKTLDMEGLPVTFETNVVLMGEGPLLVSKHRVDLRVWQVFARAFDRDGVPLGPKTRVADPDMDEQPSPQLGAAGDRALAVWEEWDIDFVNKPVLLKARLLDRLGKPMGPVLGLLATYRDPLGESAWASAPPVWNGEEFAVFWSDSAGKLLMTRVRADGTLFDPPTVLVTSDVDGDGSEKFICEFEALWTGEHYLVAVNVQEDCSSAPKPDMRLLKVSREGQLLPPGRGSLGWMRCDTATHQPGLRAGGGRVAG